MLESVRRLAADLERAVDTIQGLADHECSTAHASVSQSVRLASSILKSLYPRPTAPSSAFSAANRNVSIVGGLSIKAVSASSERHGLVAMPPNATRADVIARRSFATTTATETSANAYDARSRTLRYS